MYLYVEIIIVENRSVGETNMNDRSSRSHTIFTLTVESRLRDEEGGDGTVKVASLVSICNMYIHCISMYCIYTCMYMYMYLCGPLHT